jgi:DNA-binding transcriptional LysR family regulator
MELEDIAAFVEVASAGGFGRAAQRLGLSKSIVSRRVARLEENLGAQLLSRTTRGVAVTEAGLAFKDRAARVLEDLEGAREAVGQSGGEIVGSLRLSAPSSFGAMHLGPVLAELAVRHPRLRMEAEFSDRYVDLIGERFDAAIRIGALVDSSLIARKIAPILGAAVASPAYLAKHGEPRTPAELSQHEALMQGSELWRFREGDKETVIRPEGRFKANDGPTLVAAAEAGLGIALLPTFLSGKAIEAGRLVPILMDYALPEAGLYLVRPPPAGPMSGKLKALTDLLIERFGGEPYWDVCQMHGRAAQA